MGTITFGARAYIHAFFACVQQQQQKTAKIFTRKSRAKHQYRYTILCRSFLFLFLLQHWQYTQIKWRSVCRIHFFHAHMCRYMFIFLFMAEHKKWNQWSTLFHLRASMVQCNHPFLISLYSANDLIVVYFKMDTNGCVYMHINHPHHLPNCHSHCLFYLCCTEIWWWFYFCHGWILFG